MRPGSSEDARSLSLVCFHLYEDEASGKCMRAWRAACERAIDSLELEAAPLRGVEHPGPHNLLAPGHQGSHLLVHLRSVIQNSEGGGKLWTPGLRMEGRTKKTHQGRSPQCPLSI
ncbi:unnamed protein product [Rangifer tarandus platyrhynchus]|uniref:Uncharacterized protein n=1 Tax=Rangifer tarandus platyrhynchus TaxID=3082113 RepID=A0AC60A7P9_RANTA